MSKLNYQTFSHSLCVWARAASYFSKSIVALERATQEQLEEMLEILSSYIKLAVDIERGILAGGGELHADCQGERILLNTVHQW